MEVKNLALAGVLLFLQLTPLTNALSSNQPENQQVSESICDGDVCHVSPHNFWQLQELIHTNLIIILNGAQFSVGESKGFIVIENVSNLTISGGETGSLIECSPHSTFGLHLRNATNITLTRLRFRNCGSAIPAQLMEHINYQYLHEDSECTSQVSKHNKTTLLFEVSRNVVVMEISIEYSFPGFALTLVDFASHDNYKKPVFFTDSVHPNVRVINSTISHSKGSIVILGTTSLLVENTNISNCSYGIVSCNADVIIRNSDVINCSASYMVGGSLTVRERLTMKRSWLETHGTNLYIHYGKIYFCGVQDDNIPLALYNSRIQLNNSTLSFTENHVTISLFVLEDCNVNMTNGSSLIITNNVKSYKTHFTRSSWRMTPDSDLLMTRNIGVSIFFVSTTATLAGPVRIAYNTRTPYAPLGLMNSRVMFQGELEMVGNSGASGGIYARNSDLFLVDRASFSDNHGTNGGAVTLISSVMYISPNANVDFTRNHALELGGAIYISKPRAEYTCINNIVSCSIQVFTNDTHSHCQLFSLKFNQNKADIAGNAIYGGLTSACIPSNAYDFCLNCWHSVARTVYEYNDDHSVLSNFTSDPTRVCFCENGVPDCYRVVRSVAVYPGEHFSLSLVVVGYGLGTVPGSVIARGHNVLGNEFEHSQKIGGLECQDLSYSIVSVKHKEEINLGVETTPLFFSPLTQAENVVENLLHNPGPNTYDNFFHIPLSVRVSLLPCPVGFQLVRGRCVCQQILLDNNINTCSISNGTALILRPAPYWVGLPNDTNSSILVHPHCPFDYCQSKGINITSESFNTQCQNQRSGVLCGSCQDGLSMILGSSECKTCSKVYFVPITLFILFGVALVTTLTLLNMTVSVGTLNGLILTANILQAHRAIFLPPTTSHTSSLIVFLGAFVAWLNLDLGIPMCLFDGLTTYVKTWLQFLFPVYILALVAVLIIASSYSTRVTQLLGTNTVSVLATLIFLSYTKILRILITAFSFTMLTGSQGYHSVVWLADGNIKYFELKHTVLFLVAFLVLLLLGIPYTVTLTAAPWIQRSRFKWVSSLYNRFKPLFDAYMGPYKDNFRYWTGMLLLARVVLIVLFSSIANTKTGAGTQLNLLLLTISSCGLISLTAYFKPYKNKLLNRLELFHLTILFILSSSNLYFFSSGDGVEQRSYIYMVLVGICFLVFLGICVGHVWYSCRVRKFWTERRQTPSDQREEGERRPLLWHRARVRAEDEDRERDEVTFSVVGVSNTTSYGGVRESVVELMDDPPQ